MFKKATLGITCPKCGHTTDKTVAWIKANDELVCGGCGSTIHLEREELLAGLEKAEKSVADLRKSLRSFGKRR